MGYDGTLKFDTKIDTTGFMSGLGILKKAGVAGGAAVATGLGIAVKTTYWESRSKAIRELMRSFSPVAATSCSPIPSVSCPRHRFVFSAETPCEASFRISETSGVRTASSLL